MDENEFGNWYSAQNMKSPFKIVNFEKNLAFKIVQILLLDYFADATTTKLRMADCDAKCC